MMEPTLTQNSALYFVQHKETRPHHSFFQRLGIPVGKAGKDEPERQLPAPLFRWPRIRWNTKR